MSKFSANAELSATSVRQSELQIKTVGIRADTVNSDNIYNRIYNSITNVTQVLRGKCTSFRRIDKPTANFVGRRNQLDELHRLLQLCSTKSSLMERIVYLHGFEGMGTGELARQYFEQHKNIKIIQNVAWINSETKASLKKSFKKIADIFGLEAKSVDAEEIAQRVFDSFSENPNLKSGLFIFNHVESVDENSDIWNYLPKHQAKLPLFLITTRSKTWGNEENNIIEIPRLSDEESEKLLRKGLDLYRFQKNNSKIQTAIHSLALALDGYPFGLTVAASNICYKGSANAAEKIQKYIKRLHVPNSGWMEDEIKTSKGLTRKYSPSMDTVWNKIIHKIKEMGAEGKCALTLLSIIAYLPTDVIRKSIVDQIIEFCYSPLRDDLEDGYKILEDYSFIRLIKKDENNFEIGANAHLQRCTRESLDSKGDHSYLLSIGRFLCEKGISPYDNEIPISIHRCLQQRNWPDKSLLFSIEFLCSAVVEKDYNSTELVLDLYAAIESEDKAFSHLLGDGYTTLFEMLLFISSEMNDKEINIPATQRSSWNTKYEKEFDAALRLFSKFLIQDNLPIPSDICAPVMRQIKSCLYGLSTGKYNFRDDQRIVTKMQESFTTALVHASNSSGSSILQMSYGCLRQGFYYQGGRNAIFNLETAINLHLKYCPSSLQTKEYWISGGPLAHIDLINGLKWLKEKRTDPAVVTDVEKTIVKKLMSPNGLQVVQQHLYFIFRDFDCDDWTLLGLLLILVTEYDCAEDLKKLSKFLDSLKKLTKKAFSLPPSSNKWGMHIAWLLLWFGLFPENKEFEDTDGLKWSLKDSVGDEIKHLSSYLNENEIWKEFKFAHYEDLMIQALRPLLKLSASNPKSGPTFKSAVELMERDIKGRLKLYDACYSWKTEFERNFNFKTRKDMPIEILDIGKKYGFIIV